MAEFLIQWLPPILWVGGLSLLLAVASYQRYCRQSLDRAWWDAGLLLVAAGALLGSSQLWERLGWLAVLLLWILSILQRRREAR